MAYLGEKGILFSPQVTVQTPTKTSELENDSGFITEEGAQALVPTKTSELENDSGFITEEDAREQYVGLNNFNIVVKKADKNQTDIVHLQGTVSDMEKQIGELEGICYDLKEVHNYNLTLSCIGSDESMTGYVPEIDTFTVDLKAGRTYKLSIVAPCVGTGILWVYLNSITCTCEYKTDSYDCLLKPESDITTLTIGGIDVDGIAEDVFAGEVNIVVEEQTAIDEKLGDIETALDGIIAIQENLIGGGTQ